MSAVKTTRVAIALRYSSHLQHERSLDDQERNCRRFVDAQPGWSVAEDCVCRDAAKSGASIAGREGFHRLVEGLRRTPCPFDVVVVDDLGRLTREADRTISVFKELVARGVRLVGVSDGFDSLRKGAKLEAGIRGLINEAYLDDLAEKTHRGLEGQFLRGFHAGGRLFGYRTSAVYEDDVVGPHGERSVAGYAIQIHEPEAAVVRLIFECYVETGWTVNAIVRHLNAGGIPGPGANIRKGAHRRGWAHSSVVALIDSEKYAGKWLWNRSRWFKDAVTGRRRYQRRPELEWTKRDVPELAIVQPATWASAQARRAVSRTKFPRFAAQPGKGSLRGVPVKYLLSGLLICSSCGGSISIIGGRKKKTALGDLASYFTYACVSHSKKGQSFCANRRTFSRLKIERTILTGVRREVLHPDAFSALLARMRKTIAEQTSKGRGRERLAELDRERARLNEELNRLTELFAQTGSSAATVAAAISSREKRLGVLAHEQQALLAAPTSEATLPDAEDLRGYLDELGANLEAGQERARRFLEKHVGKIRVGPKGSGPRPPLWASGRFEFGRLGESTKYSAPQVGDQQKT